MVVARRTYLVHTYERRQSEPWVLFGSWHYQGESQQPWYSKSHLVICAGPKRVISCTAFS